MKTSPIDIMHDLFGELPGHKCKDCSNLYKYTANRSWFKCTVWGYSSSVASDFRQKWTACGMYNKTYDQIPIKDWYKHHRQHKSEEQIDGQMSFRGLKTWNTF